MELEKNILLELFQLQKEPFSWPFLRDFHMNFWSLSFFIFLQLKLKLQFKVHWVIFKYNGNVRYMMIFFFLLLKFNVSRTDVIWECQKVFLVLSTVIFVPYYNRKYDHVSSGLGIYYMYKQTRHFVYL